MTAPAVRRQDDKVRRLVDDGPRETSADIAAPKYQAADDDALTRHLAADPVQILLRHPLVAADEEITQFERFGLRWPDLGQFRDRDHVNEHDFPLLRACQANGQGHGAFRPRRPVQGHKDPAIGDGTAIRDRMRHQQERAGGMIEDAARCVAKVRGRGMVLAVGAEYA